jgi:peptide deformylase
MQLVDHKHPLLNKKLDEIEDVNIEDLRSIIDSMYSFVDQQGGAGLSANQVGIDKRIFIVKWGEYKQTFINPIITWTSEKNILLEEGCLTFPGVFIGVKRPDAIRMTYIDDNGEKQEEQLFTGITNRIILHEYDHMEGMFYYDHLSKLQKDRLKAKVSKKLSIKF